MKCVLLFPSVHQVMKVEKLLKGKGVEVDLIPVPREISSDCGVAVEVPWEKREEALSSLNESRISVSEFYWRDREGKFKKADNI